MRPSAPTSASFRFSLDDVPMHERGDALRRLHERGLLPLEPLTDHVPHVRISKSFLPGAAILSGTLGGLRQEGSAQGQGVNDDIFFTVNLAGCSTAVQKHHEVTFRDGEAVVLSCADGNFGVVRPDPVRFLGLRVPRKHLAPLVAGLDDRTMRPIASSNYPLRLLTNYLGAIADLEAALSPEMSRVVVAHVHDLIALCVGATPDPTVVAQGSVRAARLRAIKADVVVNLEGGGLSVATVAARHGLTPRYLHKLFEGEGITFTQFILQQRLERAYRLLRDERFIMRNITAIAYGVGFGDLSYFNRAFRRRYGATPSDIRAAASDGKLSAIKPGERSRGN